jgi:hypothetical protein
VSTLQNLRPDRAREPATLVTKRVRRRREALAGVAPELRHPLLYVDLSITNATVLRILRRVPLPGRRVQPGVQLRRISVPSRQGNVPVVVYDVPRRNRQTGALLWIHGGGTVFGTPRQGNAWCSRIASELELPVVSVDYRLAPEHPFPAGLDDCFDALGWPRHIDFLRRTLTVEETIVEVSKKHSPTGQRYLLKPYPKDNEPRTFGVRQAWLDAIAAHIQVNGIGHDDLLFPTRAGTPISRNTFRTRTWLPAVKASGVDFPVRVHDLRHAHASWLLAGGADLMSVMERMGHSQIQTTQKYLHTLPDTDQRNLDALTRVQTRRDP